MTPDAWRATGMAAVLLAEIVAGDSYVGSTYDTTDGLMSFMSSSTGKSTNGHEKQLGLAIFRREIY